MHREADRSGPIQCPVDQVISSHENGPVPSCADPLAGGSLMLAFDHSTTDTLFDIEKFIENFGERSSAVESHRLVRC